MGMQKGSRWKRLAVFSDDRNNMIAPVLTSQLHARHIQTQWWKRTVKATICAPPRTGPQMIGRANHPQSEEWLMVRIGDWPLAYVLAKDLGVSL